ncbi:Arc family DNA-binding protein [Acinetobacter pragensis]|uniref:DNA-binding protein n=1 Tax=Acinetobacter pragensis TaxID=1806892 RepID=A0A151Y5F1_9GAMM|nr:Arc family DNA-binding protein [Acinetobacter pragensis]KYQ73271.1 DNA-binding protein [Acinetobacter pragensis]
MSRQDRQLNIRIPHKLIAELKKNAEVNKRSMTAQLNFIIEEWLKNQPNS